MSTTSNPPTAAAADDEIVTMRIFPAPREQIFQAFSDPAILAQWWGPKDFTNVFEVFDLKPGGEWHLVMRSPTGTEYPNELKFVEVARPSRVVFEHLGPMHWYEMTMTLDEEAGGTRLTWRMRFESVEEAQKVRQFVAIANEQNFDRLHACLAKMA